VCTFLTPTLLPYSEFFDLKSAAEFIARYVTYEPLCCDDSLGQVVVSPSQTLESAAGDCFDISFLLASLLLGAGYDAFVVFGKAPKWIRLKDQSHQQLILTQQGNDSVAICIKDECFTNKQSSSEDSDTHCWVLVKAGVTKDVEEDIFIEVSTGATYSVVDKSPYSQVDSVCNDKSCLINVGGDNAMAFDFDNTKRWVSVLPETYTLPTSSWTKAISLPMDKFLLRYPPDGKRVILLEKAKVELFGDNVDPQGVVSRVTQYEDTARTVALESIEIFSPTHRTDSMIKRRQKPLDNMHHEYFSVQQEHFITERMEVAGKMSSLKFLPNRGLMDSSRGPSRSKRTTRLPLLQSTLITVLIILFVERFIFHNYQMMPSQKNQNVFQVVAAVESELSNLFMSTLQKVLMILSLYLVDRSWSMKVVFERCTMPSTKCYRLKPSSV